MTLVIAVQCMPVHGHAYCLDFLLAEGLGQPQVAGYRQDMLVLNGKTEIDA